jgi:hypothetical protein
VSELRSQLKHLKSKAKDKLRGELKIKDVEKNLLQNQVKDYKKGRKKDELELKQLQASLLKEQGTLSDTRTIYATTRRNIDVLAAAVKELNSANKKLNKQVKADLSLKYEHDEKMMHMELQHERYISKHTKDEDILCHELAKKRKDTQDAAGIRHKQMNINNGQFNAHVSLDMVSFIFQIFSTLICNSPSSLLLRHSAMRHLLALMLQCRHRCSPWQ